LTEPTKASGSQAFATSLRLTSEERPAAQPRWRHDTMTKNMTVRLPDDLTIDS